jgi:acetyl-CoA carboxylase biotin carboxylase subunit
MFGKVLIANRGEIALRVARTCREAGIRTVAVYSTADRDTAAVQFADETVHIGPPPAKGSYLNHAAILEAALTHGAQAVHPGYGFLSEDPDFATACEENGLVLIGPPAAVMARLGSKISARELMAEAGLPLLPGSLRPLGESDAQAVADDIGYPVIIKASAGGGGRGMTIVTEKADFADAYRRTRATARMLFGDDQVYVERYLAHARHVEVQVLCDAHGNAVHLGTRDCSVQRRHQKLVEEGPAPRLTPELAERIGEAAVRGAVAAGYVSAGTFEFLLAPDGNFYFMEVNCRIQVEHPVTEAVTGVDLVREQLLVAAGSQLRLTQADVRLNGVSVECRINAEDPDRDFAPAPGTVTGFRPAGGPYAGYKVPPNYDSLLAKLIVWAPDREGALARMRRALEEFEVTGVPTTIGFLARVIDDPAFRAAEHDTGLVARLTG